MDIRYTRGLDQMSLNQWINDKRISSCLPSTSEEEKLNFSRTWMYYATRKAGLSVVLNDHVIGMAVFILMPYQKVQHHAILQMIIHPDFQNQGIGSSLLKNMCHLAKQYLNLEALYMEYFGPELPLKFLTKRGFSTYAIQKGYVQGSYPDKFLLELFL